MACNNVTCHYDAASAAYRAAMDEAAVAFANAAATMDDRLAAFDEVLKTMAESTAAFMCYASHTLELMQKEDAKT